MNRGHWAAGTALVALMMAGASVSGQTKRSLPGRGGGAVGLPYRLGLPDSLGNQWMVQAGGRLQQQGNMPVFGEAGVIHINGNQPSASREQARLEDSGELVFEGLNVSGCTVTRRILYNRDENYLRVLDILKNTQGQDQTYSVMFRSSINHGITGVQLVPDPRKKDQNAGLILQDGQGRTLLELYAGRGSKLAPQINAQPNANVNSQATIAVTVPAGKEVALLHVHLCAATNDAAATFAGSLKEQKLMAGLPPALRRIIANFAGGQNFIGDYELLRGELFDIVELRTGDRLQGTLRETGFKIQTFYGPVELAVDRVVGLINVGEFRPRQLLITRDGEIFGGRLDKEALALELSSGQVTSIPLAQVVRAGYRRRAGEPDDWTFETPIVLMRSGDRIGVELPASSIEVLTRYGKLALKPELVAAIALQSDEHGVHEIFLTDGSKFAGLVTADAFEMKLNSPGKEQVVTFPTGSIVRLQFTPKVAEQDDATPLLYLTNDDVMVGSITGQLQLDTSFSTLAISGAEVKALTHPKEFSGDVQLTLWDESTVSGQLQESDLTCQLRSGLAIKVPVALLKDYLQPRPAIPATMLQTVKKLVTELDADDWKQRDTAQQKLTTMGGVVIGTLKQLRDEQSTEARQRIDQILNALGGSKTRSG